jgi:RimJ/RimL family protein N-acetyltransferase
VSVPYPVLTTERLILRPWRDEDLAPFAAMNADPEVMRHFPSPLSRAESDAMVGRIRLHFATRGFGLWAVEIPDVTAFAGFIGLSVPRFEAPFMPCVEIGWRLVPDCWGKGYATEGAKTALQFGFGTLKLPEIVSFTVVANQPSRRVMERLGMRHDPADDFDHPSIAEGHPMRRHVLYRVGASK